MILHFDNHQILSEIFDKPSIRSMGKNDEKTMKCREYDRWTATRSPIFSGDQLN